MGLRVLSVAYPFAPVGIDAVGGAEQILTFLDRGLSETGHSSFVIAAERSKVLGKLVPIPNVREISPFSKADTYKIVRDRIREVLFRTSIDLIHFHGLDFGHYLPPEEVPVLATLHLPTPWYDAHVFKLKREHTYLNCVSRSQFESCPKHEVPILQIDNGVPVHFFSPRLDLPIARRNYVVCLGRICPEKGFHNAIMAAKRKEMRLVLAGEVFPFPEHQAYFRQEIVPLLDDQRVFIGPVGYREKVQLLAAARAILIPSLVPETSSLVAMEALASGTPVIASQIGALSEIVEPGVTGFLVNSVDDIARSISNVDSIDPQNCRKAAEQRFSSNQMLNKYFQVYEQLVNNRVFDRRGYNRQVV